MSKYCKDCRFSFIGDYNQPMTAAHQYETNKFTFVESMDDLVAVPVYDLECDNERNWLPSRGNMLVNIDDSCKYFEPNSN